MSERKRVPGGGAEHPAALEQGRTGAFVDGHWGPRSRRGPVEQSFGACAKILGCTLRAVGATEGL